MSNMTVDRSRCEGTSSRAYSIAGMTLFCTTEAGAGKAPAFLDDGPAMVQVSRAAAADWLRLNR